MKIIIKANDEVEYENIREITREVVKEELQKYNADQPTPLTKEDIQDAVCKGIALATKDSDNTNEEGKKVGFWKRLLLLLKRLFGKRNEAEEQERARKDALQMEERIRFYGELLGEKERFLEELQMEKETLYEKLHAFPQEEEIKAVILAMERIEEISTVHKEEVLEKLLDKASKVLLDLTGGKYQKLFLNETYEPEVWDGHRRVQLFQVSSGCADQIYLALRIALQDLFFQ